MRSSDGQRGLSSTIHSKAAGISGCAAVLVRLLEGIEPMDIFSPDYESATLGLLCVSPNAPPRPSFFDFAFLYSHSPRP